MMNRIQRLRRNESGMSYVFIGLSMMAFISASMLAIDVGMLMTARSQAQNSADAGALATWARRGAGRAASSAAAKMRIVMAASIAKPDEPPLAKGLFLLRPTAYRPRHAQH